MGETPVIMTSELATAREAARAGGAVLRRCFGQHVAMREKAAANLVSDADVESERAIIDVIRRAFPDDAVLAEEAHDAGAADRAGATRLWVVDPLDGTTNFVHGLDHVAVSVAFYEHGQPSCGVVHNPIRDDWFAATRGGGASHKGRPARVAASTSLDEVLVATGFYYDRGAMMRATLATIDALFQCNVHGIRRFGTASLDLCMVGLGVFGAFFEYELAPWDFAAGRLFVTEAGGRVTTCRGEDLPLARSTLLATNGALHEAMLEVVQPRIPGTRQ